MNVWDSMRCNFESPGTGLVNAAIWNGVWDKPPRPSDAELRKIYSAQLKAHPKIDLLLSHKGGIGDTLMCSTVAHELRRRGVNNIWLETRWVDDIEDQRVFDGILPESFETEWLVDKLGGRIIFPAYARSIPAEDREIGPAGHILAEMCRNAGIIGDVTLRPYFELNAEFPPPEDLKEIPGHRRTRESWRADEELVCRSL